MWQDINVSEGHATSTSGAKCGHPTASLHGVTTQKTATRTDEGVREKKVLRRILQEYEDGENHMNFTICTRHQMLL